MIMADRYKQGRKANVRTQRMMSFRLDNNLEEWLNRQPNKGRYINELIRKDSERGERK